MSFDAFVGAVAAVLWAAVIAIWVWLRRSDDGDAGGGLAAGEDALAGGRRKRRGLI